MHRINHILAAVMVFAICTIVINSSTAHAEQITDKLSLSGWMDFNWARTDIEGGPAGTNDEEVFDITEVEFDIEFTLSDELTARVDISYNNSGPLAGGSLTATIEQAYFTYALSDDLSITTGRFLSYFGYEAFDVINRYQISGGGPGPATGASSGSHYAAFMNGVRVDYSQEMYSLGLAVVDDVWDGATGTSTYDSDERGYEAIIKVMPIENLTVFYGYSSQDVNDNPDDIEVNNVWVEYVMGDLKIAGELYVREDMPTAAGPRDSEGSLLMANYKINDVYSVTVRYTQREIEPSGGGAETEDGSSWLIAPSMIITDNLTATLEYREDDNDVTGGGTGGDSKILALKMLLTF